ncbi:MAG TPA: WXG100 family type VII secretion target [Pseudonocardiaceae bacterium]|nr:WXG100 family type VII secretion target [Pseudonocardiaceae bacterium]
MSGEIKVTFEAVANMAGQINSQVQNIEGQLEALKSAIAKLSSEWTGSASESYQAVQQNWNNSADDLKSVLARISTAVNAAHDAYRETESKNAQVWS